MINIVPRLKIHVYIQYHINSKSNIEITFSLQVEHKKTKDNINNIIVGKGVMVKVVLVYTAIIPC